MAQPSELLPPLDEQSDEDTLGPRAPWVNPRPLSPADRLALADRIRSRIGPQRTDSTELVREDRER